ncbi:hypothetical protein NP511_17830 [Natrinema thermotolerans]|uniref:Uncharacterized protein n=1 Tax=Natrinema thermotolerans TaxID=121872 RepID=A0AAF0PDP1_9EURY|nr:hypothetical protein [Natrinema thermotolerans]WMT07235.1 hypothetical protein NP511_17830 [Natrinema thermotolerans]
MKEQGRVNRRNLLIGTGGVLTTVLAGCSGGSDDDSEDEPNSDNGNESTSETIRDEVVEPTYVEPVEVSEGDTIAVEAEEESGNDFQLTITDSDENELFSETGSSIETEQTADSDGQYAINLVPTTTVDVETVTIGENSSEDDSGNNTEDDTQDIRIDLLIERNP